MQPKDLPLVSPTLADVFSDVLRRLGIKDVFRTAVSEFHEFHLHAAVILAVIVVLLSYTQWRLQTGSVGLKNDSKGVSSSSGSKTLPDPTSSTICENHVPSMIDESLNTDFDFEDFFIRFHRAGYPVLRLKDDREKSRFIRTSSSGEFLVYKQTASRGATFVSSRPYVRLSLCALKKVVICETAESISVLMEFNKGYTFHLLCASRLETYEFYQGMNVIVKMARENPRQCHEKLKSIIANSSTDDDTASIYSSSTIYSKR